MTNPFFKKSIFLWNVPAIRGGDPEAISDLLVEGGFETVLIKAANGPYKFVPNQESFPGWGENLRTELVETLHKRGIQVIGWGFNHGYNVPGEATVAIAQVQQFDLDGWATDSEGTFDAQPGAESLAGLLTQTIKTALPSIPLGACGWAFYFNPRKLAYAWHPKAVIQALMAHADVGIPMMYYDGKGASAAQWYAQNSLPQWHGLTDKPIVPAGRAYNGDSGTADAAGVQAFTSEVLKQGCPGLTWWSFEHAIKLSEVWNAIKTLPKMHTSRAVVSLGEWAQQVDQYLIGQGYAGPGLASL